MLGICRSTVIKTIIVRGLKWHALFICTHTTISALICHAFQRNTMLVLARKGGHITKCLTSKPKKVMLRQQNDQAYIMRTHHVSVTKCLGNAYYLRSALASFPDAQSLRINWPWFSLLLFVLELCTYMLVLRDWELSGLWHVQSGTSETEGRG